MARRVRALADPGTPFGADVFGPTQREFEEQVLWLFIPSLLIEQGRLGWWDSIPYLLKRTVKTSLAMRGRTFDLLADRGAAIASLQLAMAHEPAARTQALVEELAAACEVALPDPSLQSEELMTWEQVRETAQGPIAIGSHTQTRRVLSTLTADEQRRELADSKAVLENGIGRSVRTLAFPSGSFRHFTAVTQEIAAGCGYELCFSFDQGNAGYNRVGRIEPFNVRRVAPPSSAPL